MVNFTPLFKKVPKSEKLKPQLVDDYMTVRLISFSPEDKIHQVIDKLIKHRISGAPVIDNVGKLVGVVSEKDCIKVILDDTYHNLPTDQKKVKNYMSPNVDTVASGVKVSEVAEKFLKSNFRRFPVMKSGKIVGQISRSDILRAINEMKGTTW